ncbi:MAG: SPOR domain-containing protein [Rhodothermales bacterium]
MDEESPSNLSTLQRQYPGDAGVYLFYKHNISHDLKPDFTNNAPRWYFFESYHWREMVLEPAADSAQQQVLDFALASYEKVRKVDYKVIQPDGTEKQYSRADLDKERMGGDSTRYNVNVAAVPAGSIIEVVYEIERGDLYKHLPLNHDVALQLEKPAVDLAFAYTYPWHWSVQVKEIGEQNDLMLSETEDDNTETKTLHYHGSKVAAFKQRQFGPYLKEVAPYFHVQVNKMEIGNVLVYDSPEAWDKIADQYVSHAKKPGRKVGGEIQSALADLELPENATAQEKIQRILAHVQEDITPHYRSGLEDVVKKQRGSAFAVTTYTRALLEAAGVTTTYLVAHTAEGGNFDQEFISEEQLYRPVLKVEDAGTSTYLFPSLSGVPVGYIPSAYEQQPALAYKDGAFEGFTTISQADASSYTDNHTYEVFVNSDGDARVTASLALGHHSAYQFFQYATNEADEKTLMQQLLPHEQHNVSELAYQVHAGAWDTPTVITAEYSLQDCVKRKGETVIFKSCGFFDAMNSGVASFRLPRRMTSTSESPGLLQNQITINYPAGWTMLTDVREVAETVVDGRFTRAVDSGPGLLKVAQALTLERKGVQPISLASSDAINLPARASLPMLELTTVPVFADNEPEIEEGGPWTLVIKSYPSIAEAEREATKYRKDLADKGYDINVLVDGTVMGEYRLVLGTFSTRTGIESARDSLGEALPFDSWMLSLKPQMTAVTGQKGPVMQ